MCRGAIIPVIVSAVTTAAAPNGDSAAQFPAAQPPVFSTRTELVVVHVTVRDRNGAYVTTPLKDHCGTRGRWLSRRRLWAQEIVQWVGIEPIASYVGSSVV